ncbi:MAG: hypothetical protein ABIO79_15460 [Ferruginibacter sp.]
MNKITEDDLKGLLWRDISIQKLENGETVLILVCETAEQSDKLMSVIKANSFALKIFIKKPSNNYLLSLEFYKSEYGIMYDTERTDIIYPPLKWLKDNQVANITTGIWHGTNSEGHHSYQFRRDVHPLGRVMLN